MVKYEEILFCEIGIFFKVSNLLITSKFVSLNLPFSFYVSDHLAIRHNISLFNRADNVKQKAPTKQDFTQMFSKEDQPQLTRKLPLSIVRNKLSNKIRD